MSRRRDGERPTLRPVPDEGEDRDPVGIANGETELSNPSRFCRHLSTTLEPSRRIVRCDECDTLLDPYDVLESLASSIDRFHKARERARDEERMAVARRDEAKRQENRAKSRLAAARKKLAKLGEIAKADVETKDLRGSYFDAERRARAERPRGPQAPPADG